MNPILIQKTLARIAQTTGGQITNPSMLTAQLLGGACSPSLAQAAAEATVTLSGLTDPAQNPELWNAILLQQMLSIAAGQPAPAPITDQQIQDLGPSHWFDMRAALPTGVGASTLSKLVDRSGNGRHATAAANYPSISPTLQNGRQVVRFDDTKEFALPAGVDCMNAFALYRADAGSDNNALLGAASTYWMATSSGNKPWTSGFANASTPQMLGFKKGFPAQEWRLYTFQHQPIPASSSSYAAYIHKCGVDGYEWFQIGSGTMFQPTILGGYSGTAYDAVGQLAGMILFNKPLTEAQRDIVSKYLLSRAGITIPRHKRLFVGGDSIIQGVAPVTSDTIPYYLVGNPSTVGVLGEDWTGFQSAIGGWKVQDLAAQSEWLFSQASSLCDNVLLIHIGANNPGSDTAGAVADMVADICRRARAYGVRTVLTPMMPQGNGSTETWRGDYNTALGNVVAAGKADALIDPTSQPLLWAAGAQNNATYFNADKLHLIAAGNQLFAQACQPTITEVASIGSL